MEAAYPQYAMLLPYDGIPCNIIHYIICHTLMLFNGPDARKPEWAKPNSPFITKVMNSELPTKFCPGGYSVFAQSSPPVL